MSGAGLMVNKPFRKGDSMGNVGTLPGGRVYTSGDGDQRSLDRRLVRFLSACSLDRRGALRIWRLNRAWVEPFSRRSTRRMPERML